MPNPIIVTPEQRLPPEKLLELEAQHDGCMHVIFTADHELHIQLYPLDEGEEPIAKKLAAAKARFEFVFRPPTGREVIIYKKRTRTAQAETAADELFKSCRLHPTPEVAAMVLDRYTLLFSTKAMIAGLMRLGGGEAEFEGKG